MEDTPLHYRTVFSARRTIAIQILPTGELVVRCPNGTSRQAVSRFVESRRDWIAGHLARIQTQPEAPLLTREELQELADRAMALLPERTAYFARNMGVSYGRITIRAQKTRWGSCSSQGNLNFNCLLMLVPEKVRDYVIIHELCHRRQMNHAKAFWDLVEQAMPDYRVCRNWLKENGGSLISRLP